MSDLPDWLRLRSGIESSEGRHAIAQKLLDTAAEIERFKNKWFAAEESAAASFRETLQYRTFAEKAAGEIERLTAERDTLRHDIGVCRERIAVLEATVRVYERHDSERTDSAIAKVPARR